MEASHTVRESVDWGSSTIGGASGGAVAERTAERLADWHRDDFGARLWRKDPTLWSPVPVPELADRLGWLDLPSMSHEEITRLMDFGSQLQDEGCRHVIVLGMGGSSLAPEVFERTFGHREGCPALRILDSTHPRAVAALEAAIDLEHSLFVVSSKSGGTTETMSFFRHFWARLEAKGLPAGRHFVAVTDPGTSLEKLAQERGFRAVFSAPPEVGGRYSALTPFGLVPAAAIGVDLVDLLSRAAAMAARCGADIPVRDNPGLSLGAALGELALAGRDKLTFLTSVRLRSFPDWLEQLIAESTGKQGRGIVPVVGEALGVPAVYGGDRVFVGLALAGDNDGDDGDDVREIEERLAALAEAGHPTFCFVLGDVAELGAEMFRWELATAAAGAVLGIQPFDQPDVQLAKDLSARAMRGELTMDAAGVEVAFGPEEPPGTAAAATAATPVEAALGAWFNESSAGDYLGICAYLPATEATQAALARLQAALRDRTAHAVTVGFGPRFLHSTGQLHKGGSGHCRFLQLVDLPSPDLPVPETDFTFAALVRAQADGDRQALVERGREVLRIDLGARGDQGAAAAIEQLASSVAAW